MKHGVLFWLIPILTIGFLHWAYSCHFDCVFDDNGAPSHFTPLGQFLECFIVGLTLTGLLNGLLWITKRIMCFIQKTKKEN